MIQKTTTPLFIFGTRHSTLYNLTPVNQPQTIPAVQLSYGDLHDYIETFQSLPKDMTIKKFLNYPENTLLYLTPYDFSKADCITGSQNNSIVKIKCNKGYTEIDAPLYDQMVEAIKPDIFVGLTEYPFIEKDHKDSTNKSLKRAICKTKSYLEKSKYFLRNQDHPDNVKKQKTSAQKIAAVHGGINLSLVARSLEQVLDHEVDGIVVCDLCQKETFAERQEVFELISKRIQMEYQRQGSCYRNKQITMFLGGQGKIPDIEHALKYGYSGFQIHYPFILAEKQKALVWKDGNLIEKEAEKKQNLDPLDSNCSCKTCKNYSEAYIAHLVQCYELNAKILLSTHNTHIYSKWLEQFDSK